MNLLGNAIKFTERGTVQLEVKLAAAEAGVCRIRFSVSDTGVGFGAAKTGGTGIGLANTRSRLAALFGPAAQLELQVNEPRGVTARIRIPLAKLANPSALPQALTKMATQSICCHRLALARSRSVRYRSTHPQATR